MEKEHYPGNEKVKQPPEKAAAASARAGQGVNIIREKTFNEELRRLVSQIEGRDSRTVQGAVMAESSDPALLSDDELLAELHSLFYRLKNAGAMVDAAASFNPFDPVYDPSFAGPSPWRAVLDAVMRSRGMEQYALLRYDLALRAYVMSDIAAGLEGHSVFLSLRDGLYRSIRSADKGFFLSSSDVAVDRFLSKNYAAPSSGDYDLYFVGSSALVAPLCAQIDGSSSESLSSFDPVIVMIRFSDGRDRLPEDGLLTLLRQSVAVPLLCAMSELHPVLSGKSLSHIDAQIALAEYLLLQCAAARDGLCALVRARESCDRGLFFVVKYLVSRMRKSLGADSVIVRSNDRTIMVLTKQHRVSMIDGIIGECNRYFDNGFSLETYGSEDLADPGQVINDLFMP